MFLLSQIIGLAVIGAYSPKQEQVVNITTGNIENITVSPEIPYGMEPPELKPEISLLSILMSVAIATFLIFFLRKINAFLVLKLWFFSVITISIAITINSFLISIFSKQVSNLPLLAFVIALPLTFYKIFERNVYLHNISELFIYPGIAVIFVPILNTYAAIGLLVAIAAYDVYAVWHAQFMQKLAKFQIEKLKIFTGFLIPYVAKKDRIKIQKIRAIARDRGEEAAEKLLRKQKIKVNLAVLGGGDITMPLIFSGVILRTYGLLNASIITIFAALSLLLLFMLAKKGKFYPAMLFISPACILGFLISLLF